MLVTTKIWSEYLVIKTLQNLSSHYSIDIFTYEDLASSTI